MANFLGRTDFNVGQDISVSIVSSSGNKYTAEQLGHLVDIDVERESDMVKVKPCSNGGMVLRMGIPQGYKIKLSFARTNSALEKEIINADKNWYASKILTTFSLQFQIANRDGTVDNYLAQYCSLAGGKLLSGKADKEVDQDLVLECPQVVPT